MPRDEEELYERWREARAGLGAVPPGFAGRVMAGVEVLEGARRASIAAALVAFAHSRPGRAAFGAVGLAAFLFRLGQTISIFIAQ